MDRKILLLGFAVLAASLFLCQMNAEAMALDEKGPQDKTEGTEVPKYAPDKIIIKFKSQSALEEKAVSLQSAGNQTEAAKVKPKLSSSLIGGLQKKSDFKLKGNEITSFIPDLPDKVKAIIKTDTELEPIFKSLHRKMANQRKTEAEVNKAKFEKLSKKRKLSQKEPKNYNLSNVYILKNIDRKGATIEAICQELSQDPNIEYVEPDYHVSIALTPDDTLYPMQWALDNTGQTYPASGNYNSPPGTPDCDIDAPEAWDISTGNPDVIVAVVDTGVDYTHRDLVNNMWVNTAELNGTPSVDDDGNGYIDDIYGYNFCTYDDSIRDADPIDDHGHGTHVAGIIAAKGNNGLDITGVCPNAKIMALKFLGGASGSGYISDALDAFYYAIDKGVNVISNSWGGGGYSWIFQDVINYGHDEGLVMIAAAGNDNSSSLAYPASYDNMIAVAATDSNDNKAWFSNYGSWIDIAAPGVDILSLRASGTSIGTTYDDYTTIASGTSMACPHVSGLAALVLSKYPHLDNEVVRKLIGSSADDLGEPRFDQYFGHGRINAYNTITDELKVVFVKDRYGTEDAVEIMVTDKDSNLNPDSEDTIFASIKSDTETTPIQVTLTEVGENTGIFSGIIQLREGLPQNDDILQVHLRDIIYAEYLDSSSYLYTATASIMLSTITFLNNETGIQPFTVVAIDVGGRIQAYDIGGTSEMATIYVKEGSFVRLEIYYLDFLVGETDYITTPANVTINLPRPSVVTVLEDGVGVEWFAVGAIDAYGRWSGGVYTDSSGKAYLYLKEGMPVKFDVYYLNFLLTETDYMITPANVTINLPQPSVVTVLENGVGVYEAEVRAYVKGRSYGDPYDSAPTDLSGKAYFYVEEGAQIKFKIYYLNFLIAETDYMPTPANVTINLPQPSVVTVLKDGVGVGEVTIDARDKNGNLTASPAPDTDASGKAYLYIKEGTEVKLRMSYRLGYIGETDYMTTPFNVTINLPQVSVVTVLKNGIGVSEASIEAIDMNGTSVQYTKTDSSGKAYLYIKEGTQVKLKIYRWSGSQTIALKETNFFTTPANLTIDLTPTVVTILKDGVGVGANEAACAMFDGTTGAFIEDGLTDSEGKVYLYAKDGTKVRIYTALLNAGLEAIAELEPTDLITTPANVTINVPRPSVITVSPYGAEAAGEVGVAAYGNGLYKGGAILDSSGKAYLYVKEGIQVKFMFYALRMLIKETDVFTTPVNLTIDLKPTVVTVLKDEVGLAGLWVALMNPIEGWYDSGYRLTDSSGKVYYFLPQGQQFKFAIGYSDSWIRTDVVTAPANVTVNIPQPCVVTVLKDGRGASEVWVRAMYMSGFSLGETYTDSSGNASLYVKEGTQVKFWVNYLGSYIYTDGVTAPANVIVNVPRPSVVTVLKDGRGVSGVSVLAIDMNGTQIGGIDTDSSGNASLYIKEGTQVKFKIYYLNDPAGETGYMTAPANVTMNLPRPSVVSVLQDGRIIKVYEIFAYDTNGNQIAAAERFPSPKAYFCLKENMRVRFAARGSYSDFITTPGEATIYLGNRPPVLSPIGDKSIPEGQLLEFTVSATDPNNNLLTFTHPLPSELPSGATFVEHGNGTGTFSWTPAYTQARNDAYVVPFQVSDGSLSSHLINVSITVDNVLVFGTIYEKPADQPIPLEGAAVSVMDITRTNTLAQAVTDNQGKFKIISNNIPDGTYYIQVSKIGYRPYSGIATLRNNQALPFSATLIVNNPPAINPLPSQSTNEGNLLQFTISASDSNNDTLTFTHPTSSELSLSAPGATFTDNGDGTATFSWTPAYGQAGVYNVTFTVSDGYAETSKVVRIEVFPPSLEVVNPTPEGQSSVGGSVTVSVTGRDLANFYYVYLFCDKSTIGYDGSLPFQFSWNTARFANATHQLKARGYHKYLKKMIESPPIDVMVYNATPDVPSITITSPQENQSVSGIVTIRATVSHPNNMTATRVVYFYVDDKVIASVWGKGASTVEAKWSTQYFANGSHSVKVVAYFEEGLSRILCEDQVNVNVSNQSTITPQISIDNLQEGQIVQGTFIIKASSSDPANIMALICYIDGLWIGYDAIYPYEFTWQTWNFQNGPHTVKVRGYHKVSGLWYEKEVRVNVSN